MPEHYSFKFAESKITIHPDWTALFADNLKTLQKIGKKIKKEDFEPPAERVFVIFQKPRKSRRIIILGQDPYPQPGTATGRSFEVKGYRDWQEKTQNASLRNILKELYQEARDLQKSPPIKGVRRKVSQIPEILSPAKLFQTWEERGVFFLNTALTVRQGEPGSHQHLWQNFIRAVIATLARTGRQKYWLLWGQEAQNYQDLIRAEETGDLERLEKFEESYTGKNVIITAPHPSRYDFVGSGTFSHPVIKKICLSQGGDCNARQSAASIL